MCFTIQRPDLGKALAETEKDIERAVTSGIRDAADGLKQDLREDVVAAGRISGKNCTPCSAHMAWNSTKNTYSIDRPSAAPPGRARGALSHGFAALIRG